MARIRTLRPRVSMQRGGRVPTMQPSSWRQGKTSTQRGYNYAWQQAREQYLRANPLCVYCKRKGLLTAATVVDHMVAHRGDQELFWDRENWQSLCATCHSGDKQREEANQEG